ncbi:16891_t:CDS:1, partial [Funneliformis geosporum]
ASRLSFQQLPPSTTLFLTSTMKATSSTVTRRVTRAYARENNIKLYEPLPMGRRSKGKRTKPSTSKPRSDVDSSNNTTRKVRSLTRNLKKT